MVFEVTEQETGFVTPKYTISHVESVLDGVTVEGATIWAVLSFGRAFFRV